jgi:putative ABC transport system permease protein
LQALRFVPGVGVPGEADMSLNVPVLFFAVALSLLTTLLFGLSPTLLAVKRDIRSNLQSSGVNVNASRGGVRVRAGLVIGQAALSMLLLVFAGLMIRSFLALSNFDPGMNTQGLLHAMIHLPPDQYRSIDAKRAFFDQTLPRISNLPGVTGTAVSFWFPLMGGPRSEDVTIPGKPHDKHWTTDLDAVSEDYFSTIGFRLLRGRLLSAADVAGARRVAVVSNTLVKSFFGDEDPLGRQIKFNDFDEMTDLPHDAYFEIVGVVSDLKSFNLQQPMLPQAYIPYTFASLQDRSILVRSVTNPLLLVNSLRQVISGVDSNAILMQPQTLDDILQRFVYSEPKFRLVSFSTCAGVGLALALIGLFGILSYSVTLQTHEIGVRMALGAQPGRILTLILGKGLLLVGSGILLGLLAAFFSVRILKSELWGVSAFDPWTLLVAPIAFLCVAFLACYLPARRAMRVDPMVALRYE